MGKKHISATITTFDIRSYPNQTMISGAIATIGVTCSIGIATSDMLNVWGEHLLARADAAVYVAKHAGRNRVHMAPSVAA